MGKGKGKVKVGGSQRLKANDACMHCQGKGHWKMECPQLLSNPRVGKMQKAKDEMILRLGHISKDRIRKLVDSKSLEIDDLDNLPTCESCLSVKMTKNPFVGKSVLANSLLDLIHTNVCGPLNTLARRGFSYFITFTDDHSRYGYVYLMRY
ncbi:Retrovirus-related Pol polyprotein from transposon TNT 1-94 [Sesamum angolense]|uniref:Retrovirus-related Pol polyprotein from transposon TNT 1-94 n=1 Tax=Sesamum angolense TaxID=2727404 RepID=A0AAE2C7H8_9LAMI|nr:Retrovirus-related Pol polyprotein from transposon TNT 1-94 [Sesamum angolense]